MAEGARFRPPGSEAWRRGQRPLLGRREKPAGQPNPAGKIRIVWHGHQIARMVFPSGKTVEFPS
ncbi:MAG: hypothetical protein QME79_06900 [Bacillota bacterium]|nr:hypothetical protein [Bacillota bacterium]